MDNAVSIKFLKKEGCPVESNTISEIVNDSRYFTKLPFNHRTVIAELLFDSKYVVIPMKMGNNDGVVGIIPILDYDMCDVHNMNEENLNLYFDSIIYEDDDRFIEILDDRIRELMNNLREAV